MSYGSIYSNAERPYRSWPHPRTRLERLAYHFKCDDDEYRRLIRAAIGQRLAQVWGEPVPEPQELRVWSEPSGEELAWLKKLSAQQLEAAFTAIAVLAKAARVHSR